MIYKQFKSDGSVVVAMTNDKFDYLGNITIDGYQVVPNIFKDFFDSSDSLSLIPLKSKNEFHTFLLSGPYAKNANWILNNLDWLNHYFRNEENIIIFNIKSFEIHENSVI